MTNASGGNLTAWSLEVCEQPAPTGTVVYSQDFEANDGGFTHSGTADEWEYGTPATVATTTTNPVADIIGCHSGTNCWKTDLDGTYDISSNQDLVSPNVILPASGTLNLSWAMRYQMESASFDHARVVVTEVVPPPVGVPMSKTVWEWTGATMTVAVGSPTVNIGESAGWGIYNADISEFANKTVNITFHVDGDSSFNFAGVAIDDVVIRNVPPGPMPTTTSITSTSPATTVVGESYAVNVTVAHGGGMLLGTDPTGTVNVSDSDMNTCMITLSSGMGSCMLPSNSAGMKTLTANYVGNMTSAPSMGAGSHTVNAANTTTTITNAGPLGTPTNVGTPYAVDWSVSPNMPLLIGGPAPLTGNVTVSDGTDSCMAAVAAGTCNLTSTTPGMKTIVATYAGDANYNTSVSPGVPHTVVTPVTTVSVNDVSQGEGNGVSSVMFFTLTLSAPSMSPVTVNFSTADDTAIAGVDYIGALNTPVTIPAGDTMKTFGVTVLGDTVPELNETYFVNLSNAVGATILDGQGLGTITNDDSPSATINDVSVVEGNSGTVNAVFTVTLSQANPNPVSFTYQTAPGVPNPATAGTDYTAIPATTLLFDPNQISKTVTVMVNGDTTVELDEQFVVNLSMPANATISDSQGVGTITNDDVPTLSVNDVTQVEGNAGTSVFAHTITLSQPSPLSVSVSYATSNGTATAGSDYVAIPATVVTFAPGETTKTVDVTVNGDTTTEINETYNLDLSSPTNATIADNLGLGTITNDDIPTLSVNDVSQNEGNSGTSNFAFTVTLSQASPVDVTVNYETSTGVMTLGNPTTPATPGVDYVAIPTTLLTFTAGQTTKTVNVVVNGDTVTELDETFVVLLTAPTDATIADGIGNGTIVNDDIPTLSVNTVSQSGRKFRIESV